MQLLLFVGKYKFHSKLIVNIVNTFILACLLILSVCLFVVVARPLKVTQLFILIHIYSLEIQLCTFK